MKAGNCVYKGSNHYAYVDEGEPGIICVSYHSIVAVIYDGVMYQDRRLAKFSLTTGRHLQKFRTHFQPACVEVVEDVWAAIENGQIYYVDKLLEKQDAKVHNEGRRECVPNKKRPRRVSILGRAPCGAA